MYKTGGFKTPVFVCKNWCFVVYSKYIKTLRVFIFYHKYAILAVILWV